MADRIKGITIEIDGDTTKLQSALKKVNTEIRSSQNALKDINKLLKLDPGNTELLQQKYNGLGKSVEETKKKLDTLKTAQQQLEQSGDINTEEYNSLQREIVETQQKLKNLEKEYKNFGSVQSQQVAAAGEKMKAVGEKISDTGTKMLPATAAITAVGTASVAASTNFESSFAKLSTIADENEVSTDALKKQIMDVSNQYGVSAADIAESTYSAISAGQSTGDAVKFVATATAAAKAGFTDSSTSIDTLTTVMNAYGQSAGSVESISDKLITTQNLGKTTFAELGNSMGKVIPTAAMYGVNLDNLASAYVTTTKNGISTAESTTYINSMLNELGKSGTKASNTLKSKTGKSFKELIDSGMNLSDVLGILQGAAEESGLSMSDMFGSQEAAKAAATITQHTTDFTGALQEMGKSAGTTQTAFEKMEGTTGTSMEKMKTAVQNAGVAIGTSLAPFVTKVANAVAKLAQGFSNLPAPVQKFITVIAAIVAAVGPVLIVIGKIGTGIGSLMALAPKISAAITVVKTAFAALNATLLANPIVLIIAAIAALVAAFVYLWNHCESFRNFWINLWNNVKQIAVTIWNGLISFFSSAWNAISGTAKKVFNGIKTFFQTVWNEIKMIVSTVVNTIKTVISTYWNGIKTVVATVMNTIKSVISTVWNSIKSVVTKAVDGVKEAISKGMNGAKSVVTGILDGIKSKFTAIWETVKKIVSGAIEKIKGFMKFKWELPKLKLPHFSVSGKLSLDPPSMPKFGVKWYKTAMENGAILNSPTIFGMQGGKYLGGGDAGPEAVVGVDSLRSMIQSAVAGAGGDTIIPVYIGQERIDEIVVKANKQHNYRSGGR